MNWHWTRRLAAFAAVLPLAAAAQGADALLEAWVDGAAAAQMRAAQVPGLALAVVRDGQVVLAKGYGHADLERGRPVAADTPFRIGSIGKLFTHVRAMQLVEQGRLQPDAPVDRLLGDAAPPQDRWRAPTLTELMNHRAGFESADLGYDFFADAGKVPELRDFVREHRPARVRPPGQLTAYSNYGIILEGYLVEIAGEAPFERQIQRHLFDPLDLRDTTLREPSQPGRGTRADAMPAELAARAALGYTRIAGRPQALPYEHVHPAAAPAGSAFSTAQDMARWMLALLGHAPAGQAPILHERTLRTMREREFGDREGMADFAHGFFSGRIGPHATWGHTGSMLGFKANLVLVPDLDLGVFVAVNSAQGWPVVEQLPRLIVRHLAGEGATPPPAAPAPELLVDLPRYAGRYFAERRSYTRLEKLLKLAGGEAQVQALPGVGLRIARAGETRTWVPLAPGLFRDADGEDTLRFSIAADGRAERFHAPAGHESFARIGLAASPSFLYLCLALAAAAALALLASGWRSARHATPWGRRLTWLGRLAAVAALALLLAFALALSNLAAEGTNLMFTWPTPALLRMTLAAQVFAIASVALLLAVWPALRHSGWSRTRRAAFCGSALAFATLAAALWRWNVFASPYN